MNLDCTLSKEDWLDHNNQSNHNTKTDDLEKSQEKIKKKLVNIINFRDFSLCQNSHFLAPEAKITCEI
jgi:hypothetical protein